MSTNQKSWLRPIQTSVILIVVHCLILVFPVSAFAKHRTILLLYSYDDNLPWQNNLRKGIYSRLGAQLHEYRLFEERFDFARLKSTVSQDLWAKHLQNKYAHEHFDMIISESTAAAGFLIAKPNVFPGVKHYLVNPGKTTLRASEQDTIIAVQENYGKNLEVALQLSPQARKVILISNLEADIEQAFKQAWQSGLSNRVEFEVWSSGFTFEELYSRVSRLPKDNIVIYAPVNHDRTGKRKVPYDVLTELSKYSSVPVFATHDTLLGAGTVGGYLMSSERVGNLIADIIMGAAGENIPNDYFFANLFDQRALNRWRISNKLLPPQSILKYKSPGFVEKNRTLIIYGIPFIIIETLILLALVNALQTRKRAIRQLDEEQTRLEHKVAQRTEELSRNEARYRGLFENSHDAIVLMDENGFFDCNDAALKLFGCVDKKRFCQLRPEDISPPLQPGGRPSEELAKKYFQEVLEKGSAYFEWQHRRDDNHAVFTTDVLLNKFYFGKKIVLQGVVRDISTRKRFEAQLRLAKDEADKANLAKSSFLSNMSHELRTPLNAIMGFSQLLESSNLTEVQRQNIGEIHKAGRLLLELINEVLDLSKVESGYCKLTLGNYDLKVILQECIGLVEATAGKRGIEISFDCHSEIVVNVDHTRLKQAVLNLLSNAIKYNCEGGTIEISLNESAGKFIEIDISDSGAGIPQERIDSIFEPFNRLSAEHSDIEGTGIGLTLTKQYIELMGGSVKVQSRLGEGSCFTIQLPVIAKSCVLKQPQTVPNHVLQDKTHLANPAFDYNLLYIEDNRANLRLVEQIFDKVKNVHLFSAVNSKLGLEILHGKKIDLILLDINLPGMDGYQLLELIKLDSRSRYIPVVAVTANALQMDIDRGLQQGFATYLTKPLDIKQFTHTLDKILINSSIKLAN